MSKRWHITEENARDYRVHQRLDRGWEPFGVVQVPAAGGTTCTVMWFKKYAEDPLVERAYDK